MSKKKYDAHYQRVESSIWNKKRFKSVSDDAKILYLYVIINPHGNMTGLYSLPTGYAMEDLGWSDPKRFTKGLKELLEAGLIGYDYDNKIVLDKNQLLKFPLQNPNQVIGAISKLKELPFTKLFKELTEILKQDGKPLYKPMVEWLDKRLGEYVDVDVDVDEKEDEENTYAPNDKLFYDFDNHCWKNTDRHTPIWSKAYPAIDISLELSKAGAWLEANPKNRKSNYQKFLVNWFSRAQDKAPAQGGGSGGLAKYGL